MERESYLKKHCLTTDSSNDYTLSYKFCFLSIKYYLIISNNNKKKSKY